MLLCTPVSVQESCLCVSVSAQLCLVKRFMQCLTKLKGSKSVLPIQLTMLLLCVRHHTHNGADASE